MLGLSLGKIIVVGLVIFALWRGLKMLTQVRDRLTAEEQARQALRDRPRPQRPTELEECGICGTFRPAGPACRARSACLYGQAS